MKAWKRNILAFEGGSKSRMVQERRAFNKKLKAGRTKGWRQNKMGFMTKCWGPSLWHTWHIMALNYDPTRKAQYQLFLEGMKGTLPCGSCRDNLEKNLQQVGYGSHVYESRETYAKFVFDLHNAINQMLNKPIQTDFEATMQHYEKFRAKSCSQMEKDGCKSSMSIDIQVRKG